MITTILNTETFVVKSSRASVFDLPIISNETLCLSFTDTGLIYSH